MVFSSLTFLFLFLPAVLLVYYCVPSFQGKDRGHGFFSSHVLRNLVLFLFSLLFYAWGEPVYVVLMIFSTLVDYFHGMLVHRFRGTKKAKIALISSVVINLGLLCVFKYSDFVVANLNALLGTAIPQPNLPLPIGISFYTFQTMSYTIDVYRGDTKMQKNIISFGAYIALFPQLIAGPIVRYSTVAEQLDHRRESIDQFSDGIQRFITGLGKKVLIANNVGMVWSQLSALPEGQTSVLGSWIALFAFFFQIYFDFSGYSDMAIGLGKMFGFTFLENFNYPYLSKSITEFWRRWHISLGTWFKEYVYIPLGGNRRGMGRQIFNMAVVWLLTGIWHGASWNFFFWGVYYFVLLLIEKLFLLKWLKKHPIAAHCYTIFFVLLGWALFAFDSLSQGLRFIGRLFGLGGVPLANSMAVYTLLSNLLLFLIAIVGSTPYPSRAVKNLLLRGKKKEGLKTVIVCVGSMCLFLICVAYLVDGTYNPFLYFRF